MRRDATKERQTFEPVRETQLEVHPAESFQYESGSVLLVLQDGGTWLEAQVQEPPPSDSTDEGAAQSSVRPRHWLMFSGSETSTAFDLNRANHCPRLQSADELRESQESYMAFLEKKLATVTDAITGKELETRKQLVRIGMTTKPNQSKAPVPMGDVADLAQALMAHKTRDTSGRLGVAQIVLMADPGTG